MRNRGLSLPAVAIAGWLFADLLLAFLIITLGTESTVASEPATTAEAAEEAEEVDPGPHGLDLEPVVVELEGVSPSGAASGSEGVVRELREALAEEELQGRVAGMVLTFGANGGASEGERFASDVNELLPETYPGVFDDAVTRTFHSLSGPPGWLRLEIYLFAPDNASD
ncbi:hypothetical protein ACFXKD_11325 [Nocardiopsis aegyptia]|uniref:hypothetical protein n=1 Tax=Nocardiopsis aegyptia TaxID=220378 RepID=UPI003672BCD8